MIVKEFIEIKDGGVIVFSVISAIKDKNIKGVLHKI